MVKSAIIMLSVLLIVFVACFFESKYLNSKFEYFEEELTQIINKTEEKQDSTQKLQELTDWWKKEKHFLHAFIPHNEIREIDGIMIESKSFIANGEYVFATTKLRKLNDIIISIPENYSFNFGNIF